MSTNLINLMLFCIPFNTQVLPTSLLPISVCSMIKENCSDESICGMLNFHPYLKNELDFNGDTILINAVQKQRIRIMIHIFQSRSRFSINYNNTRGLTALHFAALSNNLVSCQILLANGANPTITTYNDKNCVDLATSSEVKELFRIVGAQWTHKSHSTQLTVRAVTYDELPEGDEEEED